MVKKTSMLGRLKSRFRSGSVAVEQGRGANEPVTSRANPTDRNPSKPASPAARASQPEKTDRLSPEHRVKPAATRPTESSRFDGLEAAPARPVADRVSSRKISQQEAAVVALGEGFKELSSLVRGTNTRLEAQGERLDAATGDMQKLPALGQAQLHVLQQLAGHLEQQSEVSQTLMKTFGNLPNVLEGVREALDRSAASDERTAKTLGEFRTTMERIDISMGSMVESTREQSEAAIREQANVARQMTAALGQTPEVRVDTKPLEATVDSLGKSVESLSGQQRESAKQLESSNKARLDALRQAQEDQATKLHKLVAQTGSSNRLVVALLALVFFALVGILVMMATGR